MTNQSLPSLGVLGHNQTSKVNSWQFGAPLSLKAILVCRPDVQTNPHIMAISSHHVPFIFHQMICMYIPKKQQFSPCLGVPTWWFVIWVHIPKTCVHTYRHRQFTFIIVYIWVNYDISLTWIKAMWGWVPLLTMISSEVVMKFTQIYVYIYIP